VLSETQTLYFSERDQNVAYTVEVRIRNVRSKMTTEYRCSCPECKKQARRDCKLRFAERLFRGEVVIVGRPQKNRPKITAGRRPERDRPSSDGRSGSKWQREARVRMPDETPRLVMSLKDAVDAEHQEALKIRHGRLTADSIRAAVLLLKIAEGRSADAMVSCYQQLINDGMIPLLRPPHQNTLSEWINDPTLTPVLQRMLTVSAHPFRVREVAAVVDSSKVSQLRTAHARLVDYGTDERPTADWFKAHAIVGVETLVVMALEFSAKMCMTLITSFLSLTKHAIRSTFGFFSQTRLIYPRTFSESFGSVIRCLCLEVPFRFDGDNRSDMHYQAAKQLVEWYDQLPRLFDEVYRLRPKIEGLFSLLKRVADGYCWSRGRPRTDVPVSTAWQNELLCKFIYLNLRTTVQLEEQTGVDVGYVRREVPVPRPIEKRRCP
jgi:hypothetical protein